MLPVVSNSLLKLKLAEGLIFLPSVLIFVCCIALIIPFDADYIISTDMSCLMHLDGCIKHKGYALQTLHIADVLAMH